MGTIQTEEITEYNNSNDRDDFNAKLSYAILTGDIDTLHSMISDLEAIFPTENLDTDDPDIWGDENIEELRIFIYGSIYAMESIIKIARTSSDSSRNIISDYLHRVQKARTCAELHRLPIDAMLEITQMIQNSHSSIVENPIITRAINYINENIKEKLTANEIAKAINADSHYLFDHFREETGKSLNDFINEEKIKKACSYIMFSDMSLADISAELGFSSQSYFQTVFKKYTGETPKNWKNQRVSA